MFLLSRHDFFKEHFQKSAAAESFPELKRFHLPNVDPSVPSFFFFYSQIIFLFEFDQRRPDIEFFFFLRTPHVEQHRTTE